MNRTYLVYKRQMQSIQKNFSTKVNVELYGQVNASGRKYVKLYK